jgi:hypothetical protein
LGLVSILSMVRIIILLYRMSRESSRTDESGRIANVLLNTVGIGWGGGVGGGGLWTSASEKGFHCLWYIALEKVSLKWQSLETVSMLDWGEKTDQPCWLGEGAMKIPLTPLWLVAFAVTLPHV